MVLDSLLKMAGSEMAAEVFDLTIGVDMEIIEQMTLN